MNAMPLSDIAVVLAAHGDRGGDEPNAMLAAHSQALADRGLFRHVAAGALRSENLSLEDALHQAIASGAAHIAVYPMFMAEGYFTAKVLPERIAAAGLSECCRLLPPLGLDPQVPELMVSQALSAAAAAGINPQHARLLVTGHGSKFGRASLRSTERVACKIRKMKQFSFVETAYLEEAPYLEAQLKSADLTTIVLGFFSGDGMHAAEDVPDAIRQTGADAHYAGPVGRNPKIAGIIEAAIRSAAASGGAA